MPTEKEKEITLKSGKHKNLKPSGNDINMIFYKNGSIAFSDENGEDFIFLYKEQLEQLKQILNKCDTCDILRELETKTFLLNHKGE